MNSFNRIFITIEDGDAVINDGRDLRISDATYYVKDECLFISSYDDVILTIPYGQYKEIKVLASNGDCVINLASSKVDLLDYASNDGDLVANGVYKKIIFNSPGGSYINNQFTPEEVFINKEKNRSQTWIKGERYQ